jgi:alkanesulfonate monooxygenase SsuD/methylene tetrahydromethanopterin reductase-like flavin-dependent oxidoreductase (luciferase family)
VHSPNRPLKIGIMLPDTERESGGGTARWSDLLAMATTAEQVGFDSLWVSDHLLFRFPEKEPQGIWECWSLLAALAAVTSRVEIGPLVSCTSFRNPALLAKIADTVDEISGGRLILGLGAGWHEPEYTGFGYPFDHRVSRFEEALTIIHGHLRYGQIDFEGTYYRARECELRPRGPRLSGPPIMIGSVGERMLSLLATYGDIWNAWGRNRPEMVTADREKIDAAMLKAGRDPGTVARSVSVLIDMPGKAGRPRERAGSIAPLSGTHEALAESFRAYAREGISHIQVVLDPNTVHGIESLAPVLELLDKG